MATISLNSLVPDIIRHLRQAIAVRRLRFASGLSQYEQRLLGIKQNDIGSSHIYDLGHLLDVDHQSYVSVSTGEKLIREAGALQAAVGLLLPQPRTLFVCRIDQTGPGWGIYVHYARELPNNLLIDTFFYNQTEWLWLGGCDISRKDERGSKQNGVASIVFSDEKPPTKEHIQSLLSDPIAATMLLLQKGDTIIVEPAPWWPADEPATPKAYETRNPSISVVRVNTPRLIVRPPRADDGSGAKRRPHNVRSYMRRYGNKIGVVRAFSRPRGSTPDIVPKVVKIDGDL